MSSALHPSFAASNVPSRQPIYNGPSAVIAPSIPAGTFVPGTKVQVGGHRVVIEKYLSEGGFAHVYLVRLPKPINGEDKAVLKRVAVPDKEALASMRTEVETMKKLKGHSHIVTYFDSHASQLKGGGYEVFLLMEFCAGGGLIDFMNTRLQNRLTEPEILKIFSDVAEGVACMHYLRPPLLHRDLKVENILISTKGSSRRYKLCDFGSTAPPRPAATSAAEGRLIEDDVQKHTTLQYRSPEMIDVYRKQPIDEKSDIWALGVLLYKLCYYTTPFEELGQMAILNAKFKFPGYPSFTDGTKKLIASMLRENPQQRPNIYQVVREVCLMRGTDIPLKDIYAGRTASEARRNQHLPSPEPNIVSPPMIGAYKAPPVEEKPSLPDIVPMRRGRPTKESSEHVASRPNPSPNRNTSSDPFAALDSNPTSPPDAAFIDDVSSRFPPLDQFSLLHEPNGKFPFEQKTRPSSSQPKDISQRVMEALADDAFAQPLAAIKATTAHPRSVTSAIGATSNTDSTASLQSSFKATRAPTLQQPQPQRPVMVSTGTMTSPSPPLTDSSRLSHTPRPVFRFPSSERHRSSSQPKDTEYSKSAGPTLGFDTLSAQRPGLLDHRSRSQTNTLSISRTSTSSRPSLEGQRPTASDLTNSINRSKSANSKTRPASAYAESATKGLRKRDSSLGEVAGEPPMPPEIQRPVDPLIGGIDDDTEPPKISSNVEFLRAMEEEEPSKRKEKRNSSGAKHVKRSSMPSISLSGTKSLLAGRFGEAFRRFETSSEDSGLRKPTPSPDCEERELTPIAGSEATDERSDDGQVVEETEQIPPEVRRELERRRLSQEERRVADAAAAYKQRVSERGNNDQDKGRGGENSRAASIQSKVQALLDENGKSSPTKTAEGYGRFTASPSPAQGGLDHSAIQPSFNPQLHQRSFPQFKNTAQSVPRAALPHDLPISRTRHPQPTTTVLTSSTDHPVPRPTAPPKPQALRTGGRASPALPSSHKPSRFASKLVPPVSDDGGAANNGDWEMNFSKKYPSLAGLEMVETEIMDNGGATTSRMKDV